MRPLLSCFSSWASLDILGTPYGLFQSLRNRLWFLWLMYLRRSCSLVLYCDGKVVFHAGLGGRIRWNGILPPICDGWTNHLFSAVFVTLSVLALACGDNVISSVSHFIAASQGLIFRHFSPGHPILCAVILSFIYFPWYVRKERERAKKSNDSHIQVTGTPTVLGFPKCS